MNKEESKLVIPPPHVCTIIDRTAHFVNKNGAAFQQKILNQQHENVKFSFLEPSSPYHPYYLAQLKIVTDHHSGMLSTSSMPSSITVANKNINTLPLSIVNHAPKSQPDELAKDENFLISIPPDISPLGVDIIKLTAQFTARNGKAFLTGLFRREQNNSPFAFIRPSNSLFPIFTDLVDSYHKIIAFTSKTDDNMTSMKWSNKFSSHDLILSRCLRRLHDENSVENKGSTADNCDEK
jgi:splicing factor 3A subunit 1